MTTERVLIVDDAPQVRLELRTLLPLLEAIEIVGEAENGQRAIELTAALQPDVVLMDVEMPIMDGLSATRLIKQQCPQCPPRVVILSIHDDAATRARAQSAGADDFVDKGAPLADLLQAITTIQPSSWRALSAKQSPCPAASVATRAGDCFVPRGGSALANNVPRNSESDTTVRTTS